MPESPFKFLNAYQREDKEFFFGREKEIEALYKMTFDTRLMLIVGASGTGKTSIIECGLANKFKRTRWNGISIRRGNNILASINEVLDGELLKTGGNAFGKAENIIDKLKFIYQATFKPIYLIFDQFEELFIINADETEQVNFFTTIKAIIESPFAFKVLLVMRDEFTAHLWKHEKVIPFLFNHRYRIERMRSAKMETVVVETLNKFDNLGSIQSPCSKEVATEIIKTLAKSRTGLELPYLQVFLDRLYHTAEKKQEKPPLFTKEVVKSMGAFEDVIGEFLADQVKALGKQLGKGKESIPIRMLGEMITNEKTKKILSTEDFTTLQKKLGLDEAAFQLCINFFKHARILRPLDEIRIELTHDIIALKIWEQLPERDKQVRLIYNSFNQRFEDYQRGKGSLLGNKELTAWEEFFPLLNLSGQQNDYVKNSIQAVKTENRRKQFFIIGLIITTLLAVGTSIFAILASKTAQKAREEAQNEKNIAVQLNEELLSSFKKRTLSEYDKFYDRAIMAYEQTDLPTAQENANNAQNLITTYIIELVAKKLDTNQIEKYDLWIDSTTTEASKLVEQLNKELPKLPEYRRLLKAGKNRADKEYYLETLNLYKQARAILITPEIENLIAQIEKVGFQYYLDKGKAHLENGTKVDYEQALIAFQNALAINNQSIDIKNLIEQTNNLLK